VRVHVGHAGNHGAAEGLAVRSLANARSRRRR
jgi:hypothetical protein